MDTINKGRLGYNLLERELLKRNFEIYVPLLENTKIDCIISKNGVLLKLQIKTLQEYRGHKILPVRKIGHNRNQYKTHLYTADEVDFFIGAEIESENLYIVPISFVQNYRFSISVSTLDPYKNCFELLERCVGNGTNDDDDFGERLDTPIPRE